MNENDFIKYLTTNIFEYGNFGKIKFNSNGNIDLYNTYNERYWKIENDAKRNSSNLCIYGDLGIKTSVFNIGYKIMKGSLYNFQKIYLKETTFHDAEINYNNCFIPNYDKIEKISQQFLKLFGDVVCNYKTICLLHYYPDENMNIGDVIQYLAIINVINKLKLNINIKYVYRELLKYYVGGDDLLIVNGCIGCSENIPIIKNENVFFIGVSTTTKEVFQWMKVSKYKIGARDVDTLNGIKDNNLDGVLCGCPTLLFDKYTGRRNHIVCCDSSYYSRDSIRYNNTYVGLPLEKSIPIAEKMLDTIASSKIVYTSRLHSALPSIAFGTPVVVDEIIKDYRTNLLNTIS